MTPIHAPKPGKKNFKPAPEGLWRAVCCDVILKPDQETPWGLKDKLVVRFELDDTAGSVTWIDSDGEEHTTRYTAQFQETLSVHKKGNLRRKIETWLGKKFATDDEAAGFDFEGLVGKNAQVQIQHSNPTDDGTVYANIVAIVPAPVGVPALTVSPTYIPMLKREPRESKENVPF